MSYDEAVLWIEVIEKVVFPIAVAAVSVCAVVYLWAMTRIEKINRLEKQVKKLRKELHETQARNAEFALLLNETEKDVKSEHGHYMQQKKISKTLAKHMDNLRKSA